MRIWIAIGIGVGLAVVAGIRLAGMLTVLKITN